MPTSQFSSKTSSPAALKIAAIAGALAVALGAFGAHALKEQLIASQRLDTWNTAAFYHLTHTFLLLFLARSPSPTRLTFSLCLAGMVLFSGSLYALCLLQWTPLAYFTPIGGILLLSAWISLLLSTSKTLSNSK